MIKLLSAIIFLIAGFFICRLNAQNDFTERIISFDSEITINKDASIIVKEKIKVHAEGLKIKRGIYRDFPTHYKDDYGNNYNVKFEVLEVFRDNVAENFHTEHVSNGVRVYLGREDYFLPQGDYTYEIKYETNRQIGFFETFDEIYWNVTGNGWDFIIEDVSALINLPSGVSASELKTSAYTGLQGERGQHYQTKIINPWKVFFKTTRKLKPTEGFTIVVQFPKGLVTAPTDAEKIRYFLEDNQSVLIGAAGILIVVVFYLLVWWRVGKDPKKGLVIPQYEPPGKLSPAAVRFITEMGYDNKVFTCAIISLAVKGFLKIEENDKDYLLVKTNLRNKVLSPEEKVIFNRLKFVSRHGKEVFELKQKNHSILQNAIKGLKDRLKTSYEKTYFFTNRKYFFIGLAISIFFLIISSVNSNEEQMFSLVWVSFWSVGVAVLMFSVFRAWKGAIGKGRGKITSIGGAVFITLFSIPFIIGEIAGLYFLSMSGSPFTIAAIALFSVINIIFYHLLKAPTLLGRKIIDEIEGFKMYLGVAEKDRLNSVQQPEKTPEVFEMFLPYAIALNVENEWAEKFSAVLQGASAAGKSYSPTWYSGASWSTLGASGFTSSLSGSFNSSISSSSTPPGSSSGGGGGGSSGGGGGGGGGGGW